MRDLSIKDFSDLLYEQLEPLKYKQILTNPTTTSKFPCLELHTPLKSVNLTENAFPIKSTFQISITCWNEKQRQAMQMTDEVSTKIQELNFIMTNTSPNQKINSREKTFPVYRDAILEHTPLNELNSRLI